MPQFEYIGVDYIPPVKNFKPESYFLGAKVGHDTHRFYVGCNYTFLHQGKEMRGSCMITSLDVDLRKTHRICGLTSDNKYLTIRKLRTINKEQLK